MNVIIFQHSSIVHPTVLPLVLHQALQIPGILFSHIPTGSVFKYQNYCMGVPSLVAPPKGIGAII